MESRSGVLRAALLCGIGTLLPTGSWACELSRELSGRGIPSIRQLALRAAQLVGDPPMAYWAIALGLLTLLIVVSLLPLIARRHPVTRRTYGLYPALVAMTMVGLRWPNLARPRMNVDEAHSIAAAMKLTVDPVFWRSIDGNTGGPLLYYPLLLPKLLGLPLEYGAARAVALVAWIGSILLIYACLRRLWNEAVARVAVLPLVASWGLTTATDFSHYSSEQIPVLLICLALYLMTRWWTTEPAGRRWLLASGLVLGALPFAKLQSVPMGLFIAAVGFVLVCNRFRSSLTRIWGESWRFAISGAAVPACFIGTNLALGGFGDFWQAYILNNIVYSDRFVRSSSPGSDLGTRLWIVVRESFWMHDLAELVGGVAIFSLLALLLVLAMGRQELTRRWPLLAVATGLLLSALLAVAFAPNLFKHYFFFLAVPVTLFGAVWLGLALETLRARSSGVARKVAMVGLVLTLVALTTVRAVAPRLSRPHPVFGGLDRIQAVDGSSLALVVRAFGRSGEAMAIWGWQPWTYVETGLYPATRDTQTPWQILDTPERPYYLERFRDDFLVSLPPVFIDTVGPVDYTPWYRAIFSDRETQAHDAFPQIGPIVEQHYLQIGELQPARIYIHRRRLAEVEALSGRSLTGLEANQLVELAPELAVLEVGR